LLYKGLFIYLGIIIMKTIYLIILIALIPLNSIKAQNHVIDSLVSSIPKINSEKKVDALNEIADWYHRNDETKSIKYANEALAIANSLGYKKGIIASYSNLSYSKLQQSSYKESLEFSIKALKLSESIKDKHLTAEAYVNIANSYLNMFNFVLADKNYLYAAKLYSELGDSLNVAIVYTNIAVSFDNREKLDSALFYYNKSYSIYKSLKNNKMYLGLWYTNVGDVYRKQEKYQEAMEMQINAEALLKETKDDFTLMVLYSGMPYTYIKLNQFDKAQECAEKSIALGIQLNSRRELSYSYMALADVYEAKKDYTNQIKYLKRHIVLNDSVLNEETSNTITEMQSKYENEKKEKEIEILNKSQALQASEIEKHKSKQLIYIAVVLFILIITVGLVFVIKSKQKANNALADQNKIIEQQKNLVEEKNKEISDSINYAERIQRSFLASKEVLDTNLNDYFVLFQPKDIVSGDFYWASNLKNGNFALVTADSTGHGVPGAIMSLLNTSSLEKAIESGLYEPAEILNFTRSTIIERLKKDGSVEGGKDGMDCSFICFNKDKTKIIYASANNPVWIIRNKQIIELPSDKMPVGKHDRDSVSFRQHEVEIQKGDMLYTLTDGFSDQFGGTKGKKFMYKKLKEVLISIAHNSTAEQQAVLKNTLKDWMGHTEQVDDITVIGVRV
jgi:serine phosphatase RsbU (regulator of sigma subunit)